MRPGIAATQMWTSAAAVLLLMTMMMVFSARWKSSALDI
jgi:hypothetical protein